MLASALSEEWCWQTLRKLRWGDAAFCPRCQEKARRHYRRRQTHYYWCRHCRRMFSDLTGTLFENTKISLSAWFVAIDLLESEGQLSIRQLALRTQITWRSARKIKETLGRLHKNPLIRSIGVDLFIGKHKESLGQRPEAAQTRMSKTIPHLLATMAASRNQTRKVRGIQRRNRPR